MAVSPTHTGWRYDPSNSRLDYYYQGTRVGHIASGGLTVATGGLTIDTGGLTVTAGGITVTAGGLAGVAGDWSLDDDLDMLFGTGNDAGFRWGTGDTDNHSFVLGLDNTSQQFHITDQGAVNTNWNVSAATHPEVYIHSNTTPASDYIRIGAHDGTTGYVDMVGGTTLALQVGGTSHLTVAASALAHSAANSGAVTSLDVTNTSNDSGAGARIRVACGGSSATVDALISMLETSGHELTIGVDTSSSIFAISRGAALGTDDAMRMTDASPSVVTMDTTQGSDYDFVCEGCGKSSLTKFKCCAKVKWHDDVAALHGLVTDLAVIDPDSVDWRPSKALQHMHDLGVLEVSQNNDGTPWIGMNMVPAQWYTWSGMKQLATRLEKVERQLEKALA